MLLQHCGESSGRSVDEWDSSSSFDLRVTEAEIALSVDMSEEDLSASLPSRLHSLTEDTRIQFAEIQRRLDVLEELLGGHGLFSRQETGIPIMSQDALSDWGAEERAPRLALSFRTGEENLRNLEHTVWEAGMLIGLPATGLPGSVSIVAGLFFNGVVQAVFCMIAYESFNNERFPTVDEIKMWRYTSAHDASWADPVSGASLASRVCGGDASLVVSSSQVTLHRQISMYLTHVAGVSQGAVLCSLSILIWFLVVTNEVHKSVGFLTTVSCSYAGNWISKTGRLPRTTQVEKGDTIQIMTVSFLRLVGMTVVVAVRVSIAVSLFAVGMFWLLNTASVQDLIVNAAALSFVLDLDELVYVAMLTDAAKGLVCKTQIAAVPSRRLLRLPVVDLGRILHGGCFSCFVWVGIVALVLWMFTQLSSNVQLLQDLEYFMCAGNRNFIAGFTPLETLMVAETEAYSKRFQSSTDLTQLEEVVWFPTVGEVNSTLYAPSDVWFSLLQSLSVSEFAINWGDCVDSAWSDAPYFRSHLASRLGLVSNWTCPSVSQEHCGHSNNTLLRFLCPDRCGCANPQPPMHINGVLFGCPLHSCRMREVYRVALDKIDCAASDVTTNPNWTTFVWNMYSFHGETGTHSTEQREALLTSGCEAVLSWQDELCAERTTASSTALWCPVQCGCRAPQASREFPCPPSCDQWSARYEASLAILPCEDASAADLQVGSAADFLQLHLDTYHHAFTTASATGVKESLLSGGCGNLTVEWCGLPMVMRAVCPVLCGCLEDPHQVGCRPRCASQNGTVAAHAL